MDMFMFTSSSCHGCVFVHAKVPRAVDSFEGSCYGFYFSRRPFHVVIYMNCYEVVLITYELNV